MERNSALSNGGDYLKEEEEESYYRFTTEESSTNTGQALAGEKKFSKRKKSLAAKASLNKKDVTNAEGTSSENLPPSLPKLSKVASSKKKGVDAPITYSNNDMVILLGFNIDEVDNADIDDLQFMREKVNWRLLDDLDENKGKKRTTRAATPPVRFSKS